MARQRSMQKAHDFLDTRKGQKVLERAQRNGKNYMQVAHIIADFYQKGVNPRDVDFQKIDFAVSYNNVRGQAQDLIKRRGGQKFETEIKSMGQVGSARAQARNKKQKKRELRDLAKTVHERRPAYNQYVDETKQASKTLPVNKKSFRQWRRNPNQVDLQGVDGRMPPERRQQAQLPFKRKTRLEKLKQEVLQGNDFIDRFDPRLDQAAKMEALKEKKIQDFEKDLSLSGSNLAENKDKRDMADITKNLKGSTSERSKQKGLREGGFASYDNEKTLDNFKEKVEESGRQVRKLY